MSNDIPYLKMHGAGNQILVVDQRTDGLTPPDAATIRRWGNIESGPGFDQLMWLSAAADDASIASYRVFNTDGSEVEQCGNGLRCIAHYLADGRETELRLEAPAGPVMARVHADNEVSVSMGEPAFHPDDVPFEANEPADTYLLDVAGEEVEVSVASMGNPHCVVRVGDVDLAPVDALGAAIETHPQFPQRTNVGFLQIVDREQIRLRVFERGVGETLACGTGACAAVAIGQRIGLLDAEVRVSLPGGQLMVQWRGGGEPVWLTGRVELQSKGTMSQ